MANMRPNTDPTASQPPVIPARVPRPRAVRIVLRRIVDRDESYSDIVLLLYTEMYLTLIGSFVIVPPVR